jgi:hypothetical protein
MKIFRLFFYARGKRKKIDPPVIKIVTERISHTFPFQVPYAERG